MMVHFDGSEPIENTEDVIDTRDVIARIEFLQGGIDDLEPDERDELGHLLALQDKAEPYCADWYYGEALINDDHFEDYARQLADDLGAVDSKASWPLTYIDWEAAADALRQDYTQVSFNGATYWVR
jgi:hypothetical protein